jgi:hypothetical protein
MLTAITVASMAYTIVSLQRLPLLMAIYLKYSGVLCAYGKKWIYNY